MPITEMEIFLFGLGINFYSYVDRLDRRLSITGFVDNKPELWGQSPFGDGRVIISPEMMASYAHPLAVIVPIGEAAVRAIKAQCHALGVACCTVTEMLQKYPCDDYQVNWPVKIQRGRIHRFIDLQLRDTTTCNFHCSYCYVWRHDGYKEGRKTSDYTPKQIRRALSYSRCGGPCFVNICASGETMLSQDIVDLVKELLEEGHYVSVVTNGTVTNKIQAILDLPATLLERMFFKLSYHYFELKRTHLAEKFWQNVKAISMSSCSYTIEITPHDELIPYIDDIKSNFKEKAGGALPHISYARDSTKTDFDLLSHLSHEEYEHVWGQFDSPMFALKNRLYNKRITDYCYAGNWTFNVSLQSGNMQQCYRQTKFFPILTDVNQSLPEQSLGHNCAMRYCFNGHAFIAWGAVPSIKCDNYLTMRDRTDAEGNHWVKPVYARAMRQKLYHNNYAYQGNWPDYEKLFDHDRPPALILFNSPDYSNLGDHAIALGEREFFQQFFPQWKLLQVSCEEYVRENLKIKRAIRDNDILLLSGGGYMGTLWPRFDDIVRHIVTTYPHNKIFILPQSLYYEDSAFGRAEMVSEKRCLEQHVQCYLALRERISFARAKEFFGSMQKLALVPDMALYLRQSASQHRSGVLLCFRSDKEAHYQQKAQIVASLQEAAYTYEEIDTVVQEDVNLVTRKQAVYDLLQKFGRASLVLTDRLHGMLLCAVTGTPCLAFDNVSGKVSGSYEWLKNFDFIKLHKEGRACRDEMAELLNQISPQADWNSIDMAFSQYALFIKEKIGDVR